MFDDITIQNMQYYVYTLKDTRDNKIFYVWKGCWNRVFQHIWDALDTEIESDKLDRIRQIRKSNKDVEYQIIRHGISEETAFEIESTIIDILWLENLTNAVLWKNTNNKWIMTINEIQQLYWGKEIEITDPVILININKLFRRNMTEEELYKAARKSRPLGKNRENAKYGLVHYKGIVREVYKINDWYPIPDHNGKIRRGFNWCIADENIRAKYINWLVKKYFTKWAAFPIRYINC